MAVRAFVSFSNDDFNDVGDGTTTSLDCAVTYLGAVGGGRTRDSTALTITFIETDTLATIAGKIATAVRNDASSRGITIPANNVLLPSLTKA
jgi:hypothetical protein